MALPAPERVGPGYFHATAALAAAAAACVTARIWRVGPKNANHLIEPAECRRAAEGAPAVDN